MSGCVLEFVTRVDESETNRIIDCLFWHNGDGQTLIRVDEAGNARVCMVGYAVVPMGEWTKREKWYPANWWRMVTGRIRRMALMLRGWAFTQHTSERSGAE